MSTEPTRAPKGDDFHENCHVVGCSVCAERGRVEPGMRTPRQPAESCPEPPTGPERGMGEAGPETSAQAVVWGQGESCPHRPEWHCEAHGECRGCECGCDTVSPEPEPLSLIPADLIESNPGIRGGEPCMKGTRIPAADVAGLLADGLPWTGVHAYWPSMPIPAGAVAGCKGRECDCAASKPDAAAVALHAALTQEQYIDDWVWQTDDIGPADVQRAANATKPAHYREVADSLDRLGHHDAARAVRSTAKGLEDGDA